MIEHLKNLCNLSGVSGNEGEVRSYILSAIKDRADEIKTDTMGNLIVLKKGAKRPKNKVMLCAHMDEVGFIVTFLNEDGTVRFDTVGGIDAKILPGLRVRHQKSGRYGVIGSVPIHLEETAKRDKPVKKDDLFMDFGENIGICPGDIISFDNDLFQLGKLICAKAIDDRFGCAVLLELLKEEHEFDTYYLFSVQEELGSRGAVTASYHIDPHIAVVLEATTAADLPDTEESKKVCCIGKGPVISFMDKGTVYNKEHFELAVKTAQKNDIPWQTKSVIAGGNDSAKIQTVRSGIKTVSVSLPCRYLHTPVSVAGEQDMKDILRFVGKLTPILSEV